MNFFKRKHSAEFSVPPEKLPAHVAVIMDGNGRWARRRGLPRTAGHAAGARVFRTITKHCEKRGVKVLTVYAFSTENWSRPAEEVSGIMRLLRDHLIESLADFKAENIKTRFIGDLSRLSRELTDLIAEAEAETANKTGMQLNIAVNYGGRDELVHAMRKIGREIQRGAVKPEEIGEKMIENHLYTAGQPDPDLILRPSGELRLSNYLIWQAAYAEMVFMDILWPDFTPEDMDEALRTYAARNRRFGGV
ncbi:MAG: isoprenyl transferase [Oscillospiraceae bacterium]|nr:isoprenyl transferase [Oscillospiraceae bacterium]